MSSEYHELPADVNWEDHRDEWQELLGPNFERWAIAEMQDEAERSLRCREVLEMIELRMSESEALR